MEKVSFSGAAVCAASCVCASGSGCSCAAACSLSFWSAAIYSAEGEPEETQIAVYLDSSKGNDSNSGADASNAAQTLDQALQLAGQNGVIYICSTVSIKTDTSLSNVTFKRAENFNHWWAYLFNVTNGATLSLSNVTIDGDNVDIIPSDDGYNYAYLIETYNAAVTIGEGTRLINNKGGAVDIYNATLNMTGGLISNNATSDYGGGIWAYAWGEDLIVEITGGEILLTASAAHEADTVEYIYSWYKDGELLDTPSESTLTVTESGSYTVKAAAVLEGMTSEAVESAPVVCTVTDHEFREEWTSDETEHWHECLEGDVVKDKAAHTFTWVVDKEAAVNEKGSKHEECTVCGYAKAAVEIPALDPTDTPDEPTTPDEPVTPDEPTTPDEPVTPDEPTTPNQPTTPDEPTTPDQPTTPDEPTTPDKPTTPDQPTTPDKPTTPDEPTTPDKPTTPEKPTAPDKTAAGNQEKAAPKAVKTGDAAPIAGILVILALSGTAVVIVGKRRIYKGN